MARTCEKCESSKLQQYDDKSQPAVGYAGMIPIYRKKYVCKECRHEWTE